MPPSSPPGLRRRCEETRDGIGISRHRRGAFYLHSENTVAGAVPVLATPENAATAAAQAHFPSENTVTGAE